MTRWWTTEMGLAGQSIYDDPASAIDITQMPPSLYPGQTTPPSPQGAKPTPESLGVSKDYFDKYVHVNDDGSVYQNLNANGSLRQKGFAGTIDHYWEASKVGGSAFLSWLTGGEEVQAVADQKLSPGEDVKFANILSQDKSQRAPGFVQAGAKGVGNILKYTVWQPLDTLATGAYWLQSEVVSQPLTAAVLQFGKGVQGNWGDAFSWDELSESYQKADKVTRKATTQDVQEYAGKGMTIKEGDEILVQEGISPGQAIANIGGVTGAGFFWDKNPLGVLKVLSTAAGLEGVDPKLQNEKYLYDTNYWRATDSGAYKWGTGLNDAAITIFLDPTIVLGKAAKGARGAKFAVEAAQGSTKGLKVGGIQVLKPKSVEDVLSDSKKFDEFFDGLVGKTPKEIEYALDYRRGSKRTAAVNANMMGQISEALSKTQSKDDWRLAFRYFTGDAEAFAELSMRNKALMLEISEASNHIVDIKDVDKLYRENFGALKLGGFQAAPLKPKTPTVPGGKISLSFEEAEPLFAKLEKRLAKGKISQQKYDALVRKLNKRIIKPPTTGTAQKVRPGAKDETIAQLENDKILSAWGGRSIGERIGVDKQGKLFDVEKTFKGETQLTPDEIANSKKTYDQLEIEGIPEAYTIRPIDPSIIPDYRYTNLGTEVPGIKEWQFRTKQSLEAAQEKFNSLVERNDWIQKVMNDPDTAINNPLFGSLQELRFLGVGRNAVKTSERRTIQYLGKQTTEGMQSRLLQNGVYSGAVRFLGLRGDKLPTGVLNHNFSTAADDLAAYLRASPISNDAVFDLVSAYTKIDSTADKIAYMEKTIEPMLFETLGRKYGMDLETMQELFLRHRVGTVQELSAVGKMNPKQTYIAPIGGEVQGGKIVGGQRIDKVKDGESWVASPQLETQLQYMSTLPNFERVESFLKKNSEKIKRYRRVGYSVQEALADFGDAYNSVFKLGNLFRVAYVARNLTEGSLAAAAKQGAFAVAMDAGTGAANFLRNRTPVGAVIDAAGKKIGVVRTNKALPMIQSTIKTFETHIDELEAELKSIHAARSTFGRKPDVDISDVNLLEIEKGLKVRYGQRPEAAGKDKVLPWDLDDEVVTELGDRIRKAKQSLAEFKSYENAINDAAVSKSKKLGGSTYMYRGQVVGESFAEDWAGALSREEVTSSDSYKVIFGRVQSAFKEDMLTTGSRITVTPKDPNHMDSWVKAVNRQILQDRVARKILQDPTGDVAIKFLRSPEGGQYMKSLGLTGRRSAPEHVRVITQMIDQYIPESMREAALGGNVPLRMFEDVAKEARPLVHGDELKMSLQGDRSPYRIIDKLNEKWFGAVSKLDDKLIWHPTFNRAHRANMQELIDLHFATEKSLGREATHIPKETLAKMMDRATEKAKQDMREILYKPDRTNFSHSLRYMIPFLNAHTDSLNRWGGIIAENPELIGKAAKIYNAPVSGGLVVDRNGEQVDSDGYVTHKDGTRTFVNMRDRVLNFQIVKGSKGIPNEAKGVRISLNSLNVITPGEPWWNPGVGPIVSIPTASIMRNYPQTSEILGFFNPYGSEAKTWVGDLGLSVLPQWAESFAGLGKFDEDGKRFQDAVMANYNAQAMAYHNDNGPIPDFNKAQKDARHLFWLEAVVNGVLPGKAAFGGKLAYYEDAYAQLLADDPSTARDIFMAKYGKDFNDQAAALAFLQSGTKNEKGFPSTLEGFAASKEFGELADGDPAIAAFISGGSDGEYNQWVAQWQENHGEKVVVSAEDRIKNAEENAGWQAYVAISNGIDADLNSRGLSNLNQKGAEDLREYKENVIISIADKYPAWFEDYNVTQRNAVPKRIALLTAAVNHPAASQDWTRNIVDPETGAVGGDIGVMRQYLDIRKAFVQELRDREAAGFAGTLDAAENYDIARRWDLVKGMIVEKDTRFGWFYHRYLNNDNLQTVQF